MDIVDTTGAATAVSTLTRNTLTDLSRLSRVDPGRPPAHLVQLEAVLSVASEQAWQIAERSAVVTPDADLWRLREPGYLRAICDVPLPRTGSTLALAPVVVTWTALGGAEVLYLVDYLRTDIAERPPFFAHWLAQPFYLSPVVLSVLIVLTVLWIMFRHRGPQRAGRRADDTDRLVQRLEADLLRPLTVLRAALPVLAEAEQTRMAVELSTAARRFGGAAERLSASVATVESFSTAVGTLLDGLPELGAHATRLGEIEQRIERGVTAMADAVAPVVTVVGDVTKAAAAAATTVHRAGEVLDQSAARLAEARALDAATAQRHAVIAAAEQPFAAAAALVEAAACGLDRTTAALHRTSTELRTAIDDVNWLAMVADGLRVAEAGHKPQDDPGELSDPLPEPEDGRP